MSAATVFGDLSRFTEEQMGALSVQEIVARWSFSQDVAEYNTRIAARELLRRFPTEAEFDKHRAEIDAGLRAGLPEAEQRVMDATDTGKKKGVIESKEIEAAREKRRTIMARFRKRVEALKDVMYHSNELNNTEYPPSALISRLPKDTFSMSIIAPCREGKSQLTLELIAELQASGNADRIVVMSGTAGMNPDYDGLKAAGHIVCPFNPASLKAGMDHQRSQKGKGAVPRILVLLDDVVGSKEAENCDVVKEIFAQGRHLNISVMVISQHTKGVTSPTIKSNSDFIVFSGLADAPVKDLCSNYFAGLVSTSAKVQEWIKGVPKHTFTVYDRGNRNMFLMRAGTDTRASGSLPSPSIPGPVTPSAAQQLRALEGIPAVEETLTVREPEPTVGPLLSPVPLSRPLFASPARVVPQEAMVPAHEVESLKNRVTELEAQLAQVMAKLAQMGMN